MYLRIILFRNPPCGWKPRSSTSLFRTPGTIHRIGGVSAGVAAGQDSARSGASGDINCVMSHVTVGCPSKSGSGWSWNFELRFHDSFAFLFFAQFFFRAYWILNEDLEITLMLCKHVLCSGHTILNNNTGKYALWLKLGLKTDVRGINTAYIHEGDSSKNTWGLRNSTRTQTKPSSKTQLQPLPDLEGRSAIILKFLLHNLDLPIHLRSIGRRETGFLNTTIWNSRVSTHRGGFQIELSAYERHSLDLKWTFSD